MNFARFACIFLIVFFKINLALSPAHMNYWVLWNVGQGQWLTHINSDECVHYDAGGEFGSFSGVKKTLLYFCGKKMNRLNLSHWDYDHLMNIPSLARTMPHLCWSYRPTLLVAKKAAQKIIDLEIPMCARRAQPWVPSFSRGTNESSAVFFHKGVLVPGDSTQKQEKIWQEEILGLTQTRVLILGHHGSRTSSAKSLIVRLPKLNFALASARYAKYRHPHPEVRTRLRELGIPLLITEDWGHIWFSLK